MRQFFLVFSLTLATTAFAQSGRFKLTSADIHQGGRIAAKQVLNGMGCKGNNLSPELQW